MTEKMLSVSCLKPNKFNPNVMQPEEFQALKKDMERVGPKKIDPVLVSSYCDFYVCEDTEENRKAFANCFIIVDGEHRWTAAVELGWGEIRCDVEVIDEEEAKGICYRKNKDRGTIDPFKEAALCKSELTLLNQKEIADKFLVDPSTVSHRLSLLKLVPEIKEQISKLPRGTVTPSHLEPIASLPEGEQKKFELKPQFSYEKDKIKSVHEITEEVKRAKEHLDRDMARKKAVEKSQFKVCPKCGKGPTYSYKGLPWVSCSSGNYQHDWNLDTGKGAYESERVEQNKINGDKPEPVRTSVLRCAHTLDELNSVFEQRIKDLFPKIATIKCFTVTGKLDDDRDVSVDFSTYRSSMNISVNLDHEHAGFRAEEKEYRSGEKSKVDTYSPENVEPVKIFIDLAFQGKLEVPEKPKRVIGEIPAAAGSDVDSEENIREAVNREIEAAIGQ